MIKCIAIDDEPLALKQMASYVEKTPFLELVESFEGALEAMEYLDNNSIDLMFVDINMPDLNGLEFVKSLKQKPRVIFITAYSQYALEGFKVDAIDYLLKPIGYADFLKSANKAKEWFDIQTTEQPEIKSDREFLIIKSEHKLIRISLTDIKYIEGMREYVRFHLAGQKPIMSLMSMKKLEAILPREEFMRIHKSYIVNLNKITVIERQRIIFDNEVYIPISDQYKAKFQEYIDKYIK